MTKSISVDKNRRGRPATGHDPAISVRLPERLILSIDEWSVAADLTRAEGVRNLLELGLAAAPRKPTTDKARRAASVAAEKHATDHMDEVLKGEEAGVRASRKKQLTSMPGGLKRR